MQALFTALMCQVLMNLDRELPPVCPQPPKLSLEINKTVVEQFEPLTFNWQSESSEQCVSAGDWTGTRPLQGPLTTTFRSAGEKEVIFKCTGSGGSVSRAVQFTVLESSIETGETRLENGASFFADTESNSLFHIPVLNHYSYRKHLGTIYENSSTGETTEVGPGFYGDLSVDCEIADLNGDAYPDAIMLSMTTWYANSFAKEEDIINPERRPRVHFLINTGKGYFESGEHLLPDSEHFRINLYKDLHVADLNGDGLDDILASSEGGGDTMLRDDGILLLMSQPDGSYADATHGMNYVRTPVDRGEFTEEVFQIQAGVFLPFDLNGDGQKDIFINGMGTGVQYGLPSVFLNDGDGTFTPWSKYDEDEQRDLWGFTDWLMWRGGEVTDFDLDGDDDIVLFCYKGCFRQGSEASTDDQGNGLVLINENGDLSLDNAIHFPVGLFGGNTKNDAIDVGDVNGDGYVSSTEFLNALHRLDVSVSDHQIKDIMSRTIVRERVPFPYEEISAREAKEDFKRLVECPPLDPVKKGKWGSKFPYTRMKQIPAYLGKDNFGKKTSNKFTQKSRLAVDHRQLMSMVRAWHSPESHSSMLSGIWTIFNSKCITPDSMRRAIQLRKYCAAQFRPSAARAIYEMYGGGDVLDFSAGWGDRPDGDGAATTIFKRISLFAENVRSGGSGS